MNSMMVIIRYWGRKDEELVSSYINEYSDLGDIILDPFGGAGSIIKSALFLGRRAIYNDLNPLAALITRVEFEGVNPNSALEALQEIFKRKRFYYKDCEGNLRWVSFSSLYYAKCKCGEQRPIMYFLWCDNVCEKTVINCKCFNNAFAISGGKIFKNIDPIYPYPRHQLRYPNGNFFLTRRQVNAVSELFTERNLLILSAILNDIKNIRMDERTRRGLLIAFASIIYQASKMSRLSGGTWSVNCYWIPKLHVERNPYILFKKAVNRLLKLTPITITETAINSIFEGKARCVILNQSAMNLPLPDNSVHMIITDPPFTDEIQYFELSYLTASWLGLHMPFNDEIVVNLNQQKNLNDYYNLLSKSFAEMYRVLKPSRVAVIMLHEENSEILQNMIELIKSAGFTILKKEPALMKYQRNVGARDNNKGKDLLMVCCRKD